MTRKATAPHGQSHAQPRAAGRADAGEAKREGKLDLVNETDNQLEALLDKRADLVLIADPLGRLVFANRRWRQTFGYTPVELKALTMFDVTHPNDHAACQEWLERDPAQPALRPALMRFLTKGRQEVLVEAVSSTRVEGSSAALLQGVFHDLTDRLRAEAAAREHAELFRLLSAHAPVGVFQTDGHGRLTYVNHRWRQLTGMLHVEEARGVWWQIVHPEERERVLGQWEAALRNAHELITSFKVQTYAGVQSWATVRIAQARQGDGTLRCCVGVLEDISARRQVEMVQGRAKEELEACVAARTAQLVEINQELTQFASIVSHDLKAPLRAVNRLAEWLIEDHAANLNTEGVRLCELLRMRVRHMHQLIEGILAYTRIGRSRESDVAVDLNHTLTQVLASLVVPRHITVKLSPRLPELRGIPEQLHQIFQNLLDNAIQYMNKAEGHIEVGAERLRDGWQLRVADNGPGIPQRFLTKVFEVFQRLNMGDDKPGTGMGLSLVKRIVETRGGRVWCESVEGEGSTFLFTWPDEKPKPFGLAAGAGEETAGEGLAHPTASAIVRANLQADSRLE